MHLNLRGAEVHWQEQEKYKLNIISQREFCLSRLELVSIKLQMYNSHNTLQICTPKTVKRVLTCYIIFFYNIFWDY